MNKLKAEQESSKRLYSPSLYFYGVYENLYRETFLFDCAIQDRPFYIPQGSDNMLQFFNVSNLCRCIKILIDKHPYTHIFNLGNKDIVTVKNG